ncbi:AAA family ATPase [Bradyrhizobium sp. LA2.1]|uniref:AAA family ATPase n=1 Tax=Bradyrhizobium sp. LA2.1 TaxID=3156376 RepID=UPI003392DC2E
MPLIKSSGDFVRGFVPPDYVVDGIFQRRFCYSITGKTGSGKTAVGLLLMAHMIVGRPLAGREVTKGTVLYLAGENPTDVQMRWLGLTQQMGIDPAAADVHFIDGVVPLSQKVEEIKKEVTNSKLELTAVFVDTCAAFFEGDDDNNNVQMGDYARLLRSLTELPGGPAVFVLCHPTKRAGDDDLIPKGGGAFLNEVDGNVGVRKDETLVAIAVQGKFRGPEFAPMHFELASVLHPLLRDSRGRSLPTVIARALDGAALAARDVASERDEDVLLRTIDKHPRKGYREVAKVMACSESRVYRLGKKLETQKLIKAERNGWLLTGAGERALNAMESTASPLKHPPFPPPPCPVPTQVKQQ